MDSEASNDAKQGRTLEQGLTALEEQLAQLERQASQVQKAVKRLRKAAQEGAITGLPAGIEAAQADAQRLMEIIAATAQTLDYDAATAFADGTWLSELAEAAKAAGVVLVQRDGRVTAYPVALRLDPRAQGVRIGRKLEKRIRPSFVAAQLRALQQRPERFNARQFLDRLFALYDSRARAEEPAWRPNRPGQGPSSRSPSCTISSPFSPPPPPTTRWRSSSPTCFAWTASRTRPQARATASSWVARPAARAASA